METQQDPNFEALLEHIKRLRGFDFTGYKRTSLERRVKRRMEVVRIATCAEYSDFLEVHPDEFTELFNTILINVTSFFRDPESWDYLAKEIRPVLLAKKEKNEQIRVWSAGCASGEEPYTLAILFCEILGEETFQDRVKIYATDVDEDALARARMATYSAKDLQDVAPEIREKYFTADGDRFTFRADLRRAVIFGRHDLVQDAPISRLDLLSCRNTLMYLNSETQGRILTRFHFALNDSGVLFLGKAEMLLTHANLFTPNDVRFRVFSKSKKTITRERQSALAPHGDNEALSAAQGQARDAAFDMVPMPFMVVDAAGNLCFANHQLRSSFSISQKDIGRPLQDLEISYRPVELRSLIEQCCASRRPARVSRVERHLPDGSTVFYDVQVAPLLHDGAFPVGVSISFQDVTSFHSLQVELQRSNQDLETSNEELQSAHEELETTNEELQSTNEELETTNEELQSTNEELETMNEELQSTNEELETMNEEQRQLSIDANSANSFLRSILTSMSSAVIVIDKANKILVWNHKAEDLWGLRIDEVIGSDLLALDIGLPIDRLKEFLNEFSKDESILKKITVDAVNRRGKKIQCDITLTPLIGHLKDREGLVILMDER